MNINERIKKIRKEKGLSTYEMSKLTGISQSAVSKLENGKRKIDSVILEKLANALNVSIDRLTGDSISSIIEIRTEELGITLKQVAEKAEVPINWLQTIDDFIPSEMDDLEDLEEPHELEWDAVIGWPKSYEWITRVAEVLGLPGSTLRAALARQEIPLPDDMPILTAEESFRQAQEDFKEPIKGDNISSFISKAEQDHIQKYRTIDDKGKHTVDTVLEMEYNRCYKPHLVVNAAHAIEGATEEDKQHDEDIMNNDEFWK